MGSCCSALSQDSFDVPKLVKSFSSSSSTSSTYVSGFAIDSTNRLLLAGWKSSTNATPRYIFYDIETLEEAGSYAPKESLYHGYGYSSLFLSDTICAVSSSHQVEIFSFKREDPPKEKKKEERSIKISDCTLIKTLPLDQSIKPRSPDNHTIISLNSVCMKNNNNNNSTQLVLASHVYSCLSFWRTPTKNQLDDGNQYHQVGYLDLEKTYNFFTKFCRAKFVNSSSSSFSSSGNSENSAHFVSTYLSGFCLFKVSWSENEQKQEVNIELLRKIELSYFPHKDGFSSIDVARHFVVVHAASGKVGYLYDLSNFRVVSQLKATTNSTNSTTHGIYPTIKISEDADVVVVGTRSNKINNGNIHFFSQENNWKEVLFQQQPINFGNEVCDLHLCSERLLLIAGGKPRTVEATPLKMYHVPLLRNLWNRRKIVFLIQQFCGLRKTKQVLDLYQVRQCLALFL